MHFLVCLFCFSSVCSMNGNSSNVPMGRAGIENNNNATNDMFREIQGECRIMNSTVYFALEETCKKFIQLVRRQQSFCDDTYFKALHGELLDKLRERCTEKVLRRIIELKNSARKLNDSVKKMKNAVSRFKVCLYRDEVHEMACSMFDVAEGFFLLPMQYTKSLDLSGKTAYYYYYDEFREKHEVLTRLLSRYSAKLITVPYFKIQNKGIFKWLYETCEFTKMSETIFSKTEKILRRARDFLI